MTEVKQNDSKFELSEDGKSAGILNFQKKDESTIEIVHTEVDPAFEGKGLGKELVKAAVEYAKKNDFKILASCPYAKQVIDKNPEYKDMLTS